MAAMDVSKPRENRRSEACCIKKSNEVTQNTHTSQNRNDFLQPTQQSTKNTERTAERITANARIPN